MKKLYFTLFIFLISVASFGQTTIFDVAGGGTLPSGWVGTNNISGLPIDQSTYYLAEAGTPSDIITTSIYDLSTYSSVTFTLDVATYGSGTANSAKIEISFDGGSSFTQIETSNTPSSSSYIDGGSFNLSSTTNQVQIRISNNGISGRGVRLRNLSLVSNDIVPPTNSLVITGVYDGPLTGGTPKGIELYVISDIADLSIFGLGSANNGGGTDGEEFTFPAVSATAGDYIYVASETTGFNSFFDFAPDYNDADMAVSGDDAIELFERGLVIDVFGDINTDGTGEAWDYEDGWAYRNTAGPSSTFVVSEWDYSGTNALDGETSNASATTPFPIATYDNTVLSVVKNQIPEFKLYPNPVSNKKLFISTKQSDNLKVQIFTIIGQQVFNKDVRINEPIDISEISNGVYFIRVEENGKIATRKLIVR